MSDALEVRITEVVDGSNTRYKVRVVSQLHRYTSFGGGPFQSSSKFIASNGFMLRSVDIPEVRQKNYPNERRGNSNNVLFVRGRRDDGSDNDVLTATSLSYILELKVAIKEYNDQFKEGGDDTSG